MCLGSVAQGIALVKSHLLMHWLNAMRRRSTPGEQQERCSIRPGFVRLSVEVETAVEIAVDILADIDQALSRA